MRFKIRHAIVLAFSFATANLPVFPTHFSFGQEQKSGDEALSRASLQVDDTAPQIQVDRWLKGDAVISFSKDHVYVVEFWATWCGPCIKSMPHLNELAERYAKNGLVVVALTKSDDANTLEAVEAFANGPGKKYAFRYAFCESDTTYRDYMEAAGQNGIPCSFVIDRNGKLAQIAQTDADKALEIAEHIRRTNPGRAKGLDFAYGEIIALCKKQKFDRVKEIIESWSDNSNKQIEWASVAMLSGLLASAELNPDQKNVDYAIAKIEAAETVLKDDWQSLLQVGISYRMAGKGDKFKEIMEKAISACPDEQIKKSLKTALDAQMLNSGK